ncbi:MAG: ATPase [Frankiales bacterium]|nr:ATPase [Frankiales bacterium]
MSLRDTRPVRRVQRHPRSSYSPSSWPYTVPAVAQLLDTGLDLPAGVTFLVGENGSGKSTLVEAIAEAYGLNPEGGSRGVRHSTRASESSLGSALQLVKSPGSGLWSYFLRAEAMHGEYTFIERTYVESGLPVPEDQKLHEMSHGESFLEILRTKLDAPGFDLMDEPEAALSFRSSLTLVALLGEMHTNGSQVLVATHSPLLCSLPGATVLEVGEHGLREVAWEDLQLVQDWRSYLDRPEGWLRHLIDPS